MTRDLAARGALAIIFAASIGCADAIPPTADQPDAAQPDAASADATGADAWADTAPPQLDPSGVEPAVATVTADAGGEDAPVYTLPPDSITTCAGFFECVAACPPEVGHCTPACHDAMTTYAASQVQALVSCVNSNGCQDEHCVMHECAEQMAACFESR